MKTHFLNVDLDLESKFTLNELLKAFGDHVVNLRHESENIACIELAKDPKSVDEAIFAFYNLVCSLSPEIKDIWDHCEKRSINIGIQAGISPHSESFYLSSESVSILSKIDCEVVFTVYSKT